MPNQIGTLSERSLHAGLKTWLAEPGDEQEVKVDGFYIDIVRELPDGDQLLIEIQTRNLGAMKRKLAKLLPNYKVLLVHPIPQVKWIVREKPELGERETAVSDPISRRKSPKKGRVIDIFRELVNIPHLLSHPNLTIAVLLTHQEEILLDDGKGSWRRKRWSLVDKKLINVVSEYRIEQPLDLLDVLPETLPQPFTTKDLATTGKLTRNMAQRTAYALKHAGVIEEIGKKGNFKLYTF